MDFVKGGGLDTALFLLFSQNNDVKFAAWHVVTCLSQSSKHMQWERNLRLLYAHTYSYYSTYSLVSRDTDKILIYMLKADVAKVLQELIHNTGKFYCIAALLYC